MPLINFGSILGFAEEIENQQLEFYNDVLKNSDCHACHAPFETFAKAAKKRVKEVLRVRRENVTEMILETIEGFERKAFLITLEDVSAMAPRAVAHNALELSNRSISFYKEAAQRLKGQAEVALALKNLAKKHGKELKKLQEL
ncbi:hypothetical protein SAMN02746065_11895 [Desulfocicer vacuolatum DSM 3385]|uniref:Rubrerythrin n=2 Tax=Desulfocicer vacuolatum TaxID=2298 RepID=A0A1W2DLP7_9BACT|nr:hypothetical protein SAMN02746065_11895 [Desulfocicer vacuolatum DSM 3385]